MKTKFALFVLIAALVAASMFKGDIVGNAAISSSSYVINLYDSIARSARDFINEHFRQASEIASLREQNAELEKSAMLLNTFANELSQILKDQNVSAYTPEVKLAKALSYVHIGDYDKIWLEKFDGFNEGEIYGLLFQGKSAGIVVSKNGRPQALLQNDPKSVFAVFIGAEQIPGVAHGNKNGIMVKFIPQWLNPKEGDEVYTSGLDGIFFSGVPVGKVVEVRKESSYQSVLVEPYARVNVPSYLYVVTKEK